MQRVTISDISLSSETLISSVIFNAPKCLAYTNFVELNDELGRGHLRDIYVASNQTIPRICLYRLPAGVELAAMATQTDRNFIVYDGDRVLAEQIPPYWTDDDVEAAITRTPRSHEVSGEVVLLARFGLQTWGHWLVELLPKALCVERAFPGRFSYVVPESILTDPILRTMRQSLEAYGLGKERLMLMRDIGRYKFSALFAVSPILVSQCVLHPEVAALLRAITPSADQLRDIPKHVALLRREWTNRNLANADEIGAWLEARGWSIVDVGELDFSDQVKLFAACDSVVSVLGSGLTGLVYAPEGVRVVTLAPSNWSDFFFFSLMQERGTRLADIRGLSEGLSFSEAARRPFTVEIANLAAGLQALNLPIKPLPAGARSTAVPDWNPPTLYKLLHTAARLRDDGILDEAEQLLRQGSQDWPADVILHIYLVDVLLRQGKLQEAIDAAESSIAIHPPLKMLRFMQDNLTRLGFDQLAVGYFRREAAIDPADGAAFSRLGRALCKIGRFDEAAMAFQRALSLCGDKPTYLVKTSQTTVWGGIRSK